MADSVSPARKTLFRAIAIGAVCGLVIGIVIALVLNLVLSGASLGNAMNLSSLLFIGYEAGFAGAIVGGAVAAITLLQNRSQRRPGEEHTARTGSANHRTPRQDV